MTGSVDCPQIRKHFVAHEMAGFGDIALGNDVPDRANQLLELVLSGTKRATCWTEGQGLPSAEVGKLMVLDGQRVPKAVLKTIELTKRRFDEVDDAFAYDEGEGDRSLQYWREAHTRYFTRLGRYAPNMMLWCERFELVERIG
jgi:uncharacterized protein YhfF